MQSDLLTSVPLTLRASRFGGGRCPFFSGFEAYEYFGITRHGPYMAATRQQGKNGLTCKRCCHQFRLVASASSNRALEVVQAIEKCEFVSIFANLLWAGAEVSFPLYLSFRNIRISIDA